MYKLFSYLTLFTSYVFTIGVVIALMMNEINVLSALSSIVIVVVLGAMIAGTYERVETQAVSGHQKLDTKPKEDDNPFGIPKKK